MTFTFWSLSEPLLFPLHDGQIIWTNINCLQQALAFAFSMLLCVAFRRLFHNNIATILHFYLRGGLVILNQYMYCKVWTLSISGVSGQVKCIFLGILSVLLFFLIVATLALLTAVWGVTHVPDLYMVSCTTGVRLHGHLVASELKDPICHSNECQIGSFSSEPTILYRDLRSLDCERCLQLPRGGVILIFMLLACSPYGILRSECTSLYTSVYILVHLSFRMSWRAPMALSYRLGLVTWGYQFRIPFGTDICHRGCAYTVFQTVQRHGVYIAAHRTVRYKEPLKAF